MDNDRFRFKYDTAKKEQLKKQQEYQQQEEERKRFLEYKKRYEDLISLFMNLLPYRTCLI